MDAGFLIVMALVVVFAGLAWNFSRSRSILEQWASDNGYQILHSEKRTLFRGPFFWTSLTHQTVYYVKVRDPDGTIRTGWVRCGSWWLGLMSDKAEVRWEDRQA
jgi:hypothetical protein